MNSLTQNTAGINIHFQRDVLDAKKDDIVMINKSKTKNGYYTVTLKNVEAGMRILGDMDRATLFTYLVSMFSLIESDRQPFLKVQFTFPLMPPILLEHNDLLDEKINILKQLKVTLAVWENSNPSTWSQGMPRHETYSNTLPQ